MKLVQQVLVVLAFIAGLVGITPAHAAGTPALSADLVLKGDAKCTQCHDESDSPKLLSIGKTKHGTRADGRTPTCTSCHGASEQHLNNTGGGAHRPQPSVVFGEKTKTPAAERNAACLACHSGTNRMFWSGSIHEQQAVACTSCHQVHAAHDKVRERLTQQDTCFTCHKDKRVEVNRPSRHPIKEGKVTCSDCHNPHGSAGPKLMLRDTVVDTCYTCHADKRGPFLWSHQPVTEDCSICHNPHGTTTPKMLKQRMPFLCQECHEPGSHQGIAPSTDPKAPTIQRELTSGRSCVNCHTAIHGGNSPVNSSMVRSLTH
jgi:DmsE family decaheme c-type cytochrome